MNAYCLLITVQCSEREKACMRLAAAKSVLRLSQRWDLHFSPEIFHFTISIAKVWSFDYALGIGHLTERATQKKRNYKTPIAFYTLFLEIKDLLHYYF